MRLARMLIALSLWIAALVYAAHIVSAATACEHTPDPWECRADHR
jgi:hypothetical protein